MDGSLLWGKLLGLLKCWYYVYYRSISLSLLRYYTKIYVWSMLAQWRMIVGLYENHSFHIDLYFRVYSSPGSCRFVYLTIWHQVTLICVNQLCHQWSRRSFSHMVAWSKFFVKFAKKIYIFFWWNALKHRLQDVGHFVYASICQIQERHTMNMLHYYYKHDMLFNKCLHDILYGPRLPLCCATLHWHDSRRVKGRFPSGLFL